MLAQHMVMSMQESATRTAYMQAKKAHAATGITTYDSGLTSHPVNKWLAASPDGLVNDPTYPDPLGIVKYKFYTSSEIWH